jgi:predicted TIM-barrel fold metal-dependent hydrolase
MLIVDAQVHIWAASTPERPWPARHKAHRDVPLGKDELLAEMDAAGVAAAVLVPPSWEGERNDLVLAAAQAHPKRFAVMGRLDPEATDSRGLIANWRSQPGMLGLRFTFHRPGLAEVLTEGRADWLWGQAEKYHVPIMVLVSHDQLNYIDRIAELHPRLKLVIDHFGIPSSTPPEERFHDFDKLLALASRPNVAVKASGLPGFATDAYPYRSLHPHVRRVRDAFGARRMFWGTDLSRLPCSYRQAITMFTEEMPWLTEDDKAWIMGRGLCEWLGWDLA